MFSSSPYTNSTSAAVPTAPATTTPGTVGLPHPTTTPSGKPPAATAGAPKALALSGAGLAGVLGLAAFVL